MSASRELNNRIIVFDVNEGISYDSQQEKGKKNRNFFKATI